VPVHAVTERETVAHILDALDDGRSGVVVTPNTDYLRRCVGQAEFRRLVVSADLVVADGMPLIWASRVAGSPLPERVAGSNLISSLSADAARRGRSIFLLGGAEGAAAGAARVLTERSPDLRVVGTWVPPFGFENDPDELARMDAALLEAAPDIVFVGLGSPKTEMLIDRMRHRLPGTWWMGVGISFSFLNGDVPRAPLWMRRVGLEWLHRLASEPRRLARRYLIDGIPFGARLMAWSLRRRFQA
jgi:N-acetylglucosaminyldiphosphoundecaprenol N-acetyl-beta-D-mannosaminyltransferase